MAPRPNSKIKIRLSARELEDAARLLEQRKGHKRAEEVLRGQANLDIFTGSVNIDIHITNYPKFSNSFTKEEGSDMVFAYADILSKRIRDIDSALADMGIALVDE